MNRVSYHVSEVLFPNSLTGKLVPFLFLGSNFPKLFPPPQAEMVSTELDKGGDHPWSGHPLGPPIVVHCSAGIGRTGTFATLDIAIRKFEDVGRVDVQSTVERIRAQRAFSIQVI